MVEEDFTIVDLEENMVEHLKMRASRHGRSLEDEVVAVLTHELANECSHRVGLGTAIARRFAAAGYVDLPDINRGPTRSTPALD